MFKTARDNAFLVRFFSRNKFITLFDKTLTKEQADFLLKNWYSLDAIEYINDQKLITLYEIKTRNKYQKELHFKPKMTQSTHDLYAQAGNLGFVVKCATVWLYDNWDFDIQIEDLDPREYYVDKAKKYDKTG